MLPVNDDQPRPTPTRQQREAFLPLTLLTLASPLLWALHFAVVYLLEGFLCTSATPTMLIPLGILVATLLCGGACVVVLWLGAAWLDKAGAARLASRPLLAAFQHLITGLSLLAIIWTAAGALFLTPCSFAY